MLPKKRERDAGGRRENAMREGEGEAQKLLGNISDGSRTLTDEESESRLCEPVFGLCVDDVRRRVGVDNPRSRRGCWYPGFVQAGSQAMTKRGTRYNPVACDDCIVARCDSNGIVEHARGGGTALEDVVGDLTPGGPSNRTVVDSPDYFREISSYIDAGRAETTEWEGRRSESESATCLRTAATRHEKGARSLESPKEGRDT